MSLSICRRRIGCRSSRTFRAFSTLPTVLARADEQCHGDGANPLIVLVRATEATVHATSSPTRSSRCVTRPDVFRKRHGFRPVGEGQRLSRRDAMTEEHRTIGVPE
jgi:hypothetical protein